MARCVTSEQYYISFSLKALEFHFNGRNFFFSFRVFNFFLADTLGIVSSNLTAFAHITHSIGDGIKFHLACIVHRVYVEC